MTCETLQKADIPLAIYSPIESMFSGYAADAEAIKKIALFVADNDGLIPHFFDGNSHRSGCGRYTAKELFQSEGALKSLDSSYWSRVMALTDVLEVMPATKRNEWHSMIADNETPPFERETVLLTIQTLMLSRDQFFAEKIDSVFRCLSHEHITNSPMGFGKRMIVNYILDRFGYVDHRRCEYLDDLREINAKLANREKPCSLSTYKDLSSLHPRLPPYFSFGKWIDLDGGEIRIRIFKKGTAHIEIHPEIACQLNQVLASLYPMAIASEFRSKPKAPPKDHALVENLLPGSVIDALGSALERYSLNEHSLCLDKNLSKETQKTVSQVLLAIGGVSDSSGNRWNFDFPIYDTIRTILRMGCLPEAKSHQYYPTPETLAQEVVDLASVQDGHKTLEPSAGTGSIAFLLPKDTVCVEISKIHCSVLQAKGIRQLTRTF